ARLERRRRDVLIRVDEGEDVLLVHARGVELDLRLPTEADAHGNRRVLRGGRDGRAYRERDSERAQQPSRRAVHASLPASGTRPATSRVALRIAPRDHGPGHAGVTAV